MQALLLVGGTDPSGGAGIAQDALHAHDTGFWACPVVSAVTVQTPERFERSVAMDPETFIGGLEAAARSSEIAGVKIGYLADAGQVEYLAAFLRSLRADRPELPIVVDPVGIPTAGQDAPGRRAVVVATADKLVNLATVITPDPGELAVLSGHPTDGPLALEVAAKRLNLLGAQAVLVGSAETHEGQVVDRYITRYDNLPIPISRSPIEEVHGAGCAVATRLAAHLARGLDGSDAARVAVHEVAALRADARFGRSDRQALLSPQPLVAEAGAPDVVRALERVVPVLLDLLPPSWVAECGNNVAYAPQGAESEGEVAVLRQRIALRDGRPQAPPVCWRSSTSHIARIALAATQMTGTSACVINLRHEPSVFERAADAGLRQGTFDRAEEPPETGSSVEWGTRMVLERGPVDLVVDDGGPGKEAMVRLLARDPEGLVEKLRRMATPEAPVVAVGR